MCNLSAYAELEDDFFAFSAIKAEVRRGIYWTNVLIDTKVSVHVITSDTKVSIDTFVQ
jgi:hypothetical protein